MIKELTEKNIKQALALVNRVFTEFVAADYSEQGRNTFENYLKTKDAGFSADMKAGNKRIWGYYQDGQIAGVIAARDNSHIALLFVDKKYHRQGIARRLFNRLLEEVGKPGEIIKITVNSSPYAAGIYERLGFVKTAERQEKDGIIYIPMVYEKILSRVPDRSAKIVLRPLCDEDTELLERWLPVPHVAKWYKHPDHWLRELKERHGKFSFLTHFIAEYNSVPIGFCQYYDCFFAKEHEVWNDEPCVGEKPGEFYSIDYLIGEPEYLRCGFGKQMIEQMIARIWALGAEKIIVEPEKENIASNHVLESAGFLRNGECYVLKRPVRLSIRKCN